MQSARVGIAPILIPSASHEAPASTGAFSWDEKRGRPKPRSPSDMTQPTMRQPLLIVGCELPFLRRIHAAIYSWQLFRSRVVKACSQPGINFEGDLPKVGLHLVVHRTAKNAIKRKNRLWRNTMGLLSSP